ncbi:MAG: DUF4271 domain-containing protein [Bacteroidales bacterium]|nr:DUF4271 domain-containing protein [Bacteroidales bacterium]
MSDSLIYSTVKPYISDANVIRNPIHVPLTLWSEQVFHKTQNYQENYPTSISLIHQCKSSQYNNLFVGNDWLLGLILLSLVLLVYVKTTFANIFHNILISLTNFQLARQFINENNAMVQKTSLILYPLFVLNVAVFTFALAQYFQIQFFSHKLMDFLFILAILTVFYTIKFLAYKLMGILIDKITETNVFMRHYGIFFKNLAIILTPLTAVAIYIKSDIAFYWLMIIFFIVVLFSILRIYRAFRLSLQMHYSLFYIFLYFCTVEIIPIIYSIKLLKMWV